MPLILNPGQLKDVYNIANQAYHPISGFLREKDFQSVVKKMRLANNQVWPIPIVLDVSLEQKKQFSNKKKILLTNPAGKRIAYLNDPEIYTYDKKKYAQAVFGTTNPEHPGVADAFAQEEFLLGGEIELIKKNPNYFDYYNLSPNQTKNIFAQRGWKTVVAFQTRNVPHRGHEFLQKQALQLVDGLMIQPVIGKKKNNDFKDEYILACYEELIKHHYPQEKTLLTVLPIRMRYAGPREAVMHALIRRNYGCTHFIVGRDHAGVGGFYDPFAAHRIFDQFKQHELGIDILKFEEVVYDTQKKKHAFVSQVPEKNREYFSGTKLRQYIADKKTAPDHIVRPVVLQVLKNSHTSFVDHMYKKNTHHQGFIVWLTGLSGSGKSTIADKLFELLKKKEIKVERLDGDVVRESLTKDLGFSKKDRLENIKRVSFVANLLAKNGVGVIASFISPFKAQRDQMKKELHNFIEVHIATPLEVCEQRDIKGLYKKARAGEIKDFTGISSPYQQPKNPDIIISATEVDPTQYAEKIVSYLDEKGYLD